MKIEFDADIVLAKVSNVRRCVAAIRLLAAPEHAAIDGWIRQDVTVLNLQRAIEALQDLANHLIAANQWELPRDGRHAFAILREHGMLTGKQVELARAMVGFRNIAVHEYATLDAAVVEGIARDRLADLEGLANGVLGHLREPAVPGANGEDHRAG